MSDQMVMRTVGPTSSVAGHSRQGVAGAHLSDPDEDRVQEHDGRSGEHRDAERPAAGRNIATYVVGVTQPNIVSPAPEKSRPVPSTARGPKRSTSRGRLPRSEDPVVLRSM